MKRKRLIPYAAMLWITVGVLLPGIIVAADSAIRSRGSFVLKNETLAVYSSDVDYLQTEIEALFHELPDWQAQ